MQNIEPAADNLATLVAAVPDDQLGAPTPCPDYSVGDLLDHVGGVALAFASAAAKERGINAEPPPTGDRSRLGDDWRTRIPRDLRAMAAAWQQSGASDGTTWIAGMEMPAAVVGQVGLNELVVHAWDLAQATGQPFAVDAATVGACLELMTPMSQPGMEAAREPAFGPVVDADAGAPPIDRLLALTGREPGWQPDA